MQSSKRMLVRGGVLAVVMLAGGAARAIAADSFLAPTKEELEMKSLQGYPNAAAVVLLTEEIKRDDAGTAERYERIKVLTDEGKKYANVQLGESSANGNDYVNSDLDVMVDFIVGRTIHADGRIIPFTGKPYMKVVEGTSRYKVQERVFTLPDVEVGSILEYRYIVRISSYHFIPPNWLLQRELFVRKAHYAWYPSVKPLMSEDGGVNSIQWFPILRPQDKLEKKPMPVTGTYFELTSVDIPPTPREEFMPPLRNFTYRVLFSYTPYDNVEDFWRNKGKSWSKSVNSFAGPNGALREATQQVTAGASTDEEKLRKIYTAVMGLENTDYTRQRAKEEEKASGQEKIDSAADVWGRKRGTPAQLTELFLGMARAAGLKADAMDVPDRSKELAVKGYESFSQFDGLIAVVSVGGKDRYFDPGWRDEPFGKLAWQHTFVTGLRQSENGATWAETPGDSYAANTMDRVANLTLDEHGQVTGTIDVSYTGEHAVSWRQAALRGDDESLRKQLEDSLQKTLPKTLTVKVDSISGVDEYEKPLRVKFSATGAIGSVAGKRLLLPLDLFRSAVSSTFPLESRELPVYFDYADTVREAQRINLPSTLQPEAVPDAAKLTLAATAGYVLAVQSTPVQVTVRRDFARSAIIVPATDYAKLRTFYSQIEAKDRESVVLKQASAQAAATPAGK